MILAPCSPRRETARPWQTTFKRAASQVVSVSEAFFLNTSFNVAAGFRAAAIALAASGALTVAPAQAFELDLPIACNLQRDCFIQNYVDVDSGPARRDFSCGMATYDGHKGVDFRIVSVRDVARRVPVLAAADGVVKGLRDGMRDKLYSKDQLAALKGRDCGNGVLIDHGQGWSTQYCHLKRGSVRTHVKKGQRVTRGATLGFVGFSGRAAFAHLHLTLRRNGKVIDPFTGRMPGQAAACGTTGARNGRGMSITGTSKSLWSQRSRLRGNRPSSAIIEARFAGDRLPKASSELGLARAARLTRQSPMLLLIARGINLRPGDRMRFVITGPGGIKIDQSTPPLKTAKAILSPGAGRKRRSTPWPAGIYRGRAEVVRAGKVATSASVEARLK